MFTTERDLALCTSTSTTRRPNNEKNEKNNTDFQGYYKDDKYKQGYYRDFVKNFLDNPDADVIDDVVTYIKRDDHSVGPVGNTDEEFNMTTTDEDKNCTQNEQIVKGLDRGIR